MKFRFFGLPIIISKLILPIIIILFFIGQFRNYLIIFACALIHELAHIAAAAVYKIKIEEVEILPVGMTAKIGEFNSQTSLLKKIILYAAGPASNIVLAGLLFALGNRFLYFNNEVVENLILINMFLACLNLLPVFPLDGGGILYSILSCRISLLRLSDTCIAISKAFRIFILIPSIFIFFYSGNFSLLLVGIFILVYVSKYRNLVKARALTNILNKNEIFKSRETLKVEIIAANKSTTLIDLIYEFKLYKFYIIVILSDDLKPIKITNETEVIACILNSNISCTLESLI